PLLFGAGQIGVSIPMSDPLGFYYNPSQLGYFSRDNNLSMLALPHKTKLLKYFAPNLNLSFNTYGMTAGYNFKNKYNLPLSIGLGYIHSRVNYGEYVRNNSTSESYDAFDCYSIGASYNYFLLFNLGLSVKSYDSHLSDLPVGENNQIPATSGNAFDFGTLIIAPVSNLLFENVKYNLDPNSYIKPKFDLSLGYSILNMGKKVVYVDQAQADPIPRTARLGYTLNFGIDLQINQINLNAFNYSFSGEAEDILINSDEMGFHGYQGMLGDINFGKHLIALKADQNVVVHKGHIFRLFETVIITSGRYNGGGFNNYKSNGFGFSSEGIFKLLSRSIENNVIGFIANHFVLEYYDTNNFADSGFETNFQSLAFYFKNFGL
ncbi:MAG: hypothetical protein WAM24_03860, partial [Ignavibacteriaceae bacterium]